MFLKSGAIIIITWILFLLHIDLNTATVCIATKQKTKMFDITSPMMYNMVGCVNKFKKWELNRVKYKINEGSPNAFSII